MDGEQSIGKLDLQRFLQRFIQLIFGETLPVFFGFTVFDNTLLLGFELFLSRLSEVYFSGEISLEVLVISQMWVIGCMWA